MSREFRCDRCKKFETHENGMNKWTHEHSVNVSIDPISKTRNPINYELCENCACDLETFFNKVD
jgi:hypothetical protein